MLCWSTARIKASIAKEETRKSSRSQTSKDIIIRIVILHINITDNDNLSICG